MDVYSAERELKYINSASLYRYILILVFDTLMQSPPVLNLKVRGRCRI